MNLPAPGENLLPPNYSENDIVILKKYFEMNKRYYDRINAELLVKLENDPFWGPFIKMQTKEQREEQNKRSLEQQRAAIYDGKWEDYASELIKQGRMYAKMNIGYNDWYEIIRMYKVHIVPHIKSDPLNSKEDAVDYLNGLGMFVDYAMYGIAVAYFQEKNESIRENEERFRAVFENSADQIMMVGPEGIIRMVNHQLPGQGQETIVGRNIFEIQSGENLPFVKSGFRRAFESETSSNYETEEEMAMGNFHYSSKVSPVFNEDGTVNAAIIISRDITEDKRNQKSILELNSTLENKVKARTEELNQINMELESFSYSVSHDLRGPLRAINGFTQILAEEFGENSSEDAKDAMKEIIGNAKRMGQLIDDLLEFSRLGKQNLSRLELDMKDLVSNVISDLKKTYPKQKASFSVKPINPTYADNTMMRQALLNLVSNALKYSAKKETPVIEIGSYEENGSDVYYVKDNGAGFDMAYYDKLFGVFQRLHRADEFEGTGVGLAIVQRIVSRHSGKVWADGKVNEGATFYFSLPKLNPKK